jgi:hypothetical protein
MKFLLYIYIYIFKLFYVEMIFDDTAPTSTTASANKSITTGGLAMLKEKKNVVVRRDIVRKKEPLNIVFCGPPDAGISTIG